MSTRRRIRRRPAPRGFNLVELLMALAISAALLTATMIALDASFMAYQSTTELASTHTTSRLALHRILTLIRTGSDFEPLPPNPLDAVVESDFMDFRLADDTLVRVEWDEGDETLYVVVGGPGGPRYPLIEGVIAQFFPADHPTRPNDLILPFTLEYDKGFTLYRATIDLMIEPDDNQDVELDGDNTETIRLVATAMPRGVAYE